MVSLASLTADIVVTNKYEALRISHYARESGQHRPLQFSGLSMNECSIRWPIHNDLSAK